MYSGQSSVSSVSLASSLMGGMNIFTVRADATLLAGEGDEERSLARAALDVGFLVSSCDPGHTNARNGY